MATYAFWYSVLGLAVGVVFFVAGVFVIFYPRHGRLHWFFRMGPLQMRLVTAVPGVLLAILGFLVIYVTRFSPPPP